MVDINRKGMHGVVLSATGTKFFYSIRFFEIV